MKQVFSTSTFPTTFQYFNFPNNCVYFKLIGDCVIYFVLYVDDMLLIGNDKEIIQDLKT